MKISERLSQLRGELGISQPAAATKFHIPLPSWKNYEKGPSEPGAGALRGLAEGGVNINWLLTGEGEMLLTDQIKVTETVTHNAIDTSIFARVLERLSEEDFVGYKLNSSMFGYLAALVYGRVMSQSEEKLVSELETSVKELNLILTDQHTANWEMAVIESRRQNFEQHDREALDKLLNKMIDDGYKLLGSARGKFADRRLSPGSSLEAEFLKGLALSNSSDPK